MPKAYFNKAATGYTVYTTRASKTNARYNAMWMTKIYTSNSHDHDDGKSDPLWAPRMRDRTLTAAAVKHKINIRADKENAAQINSDEQTKAAQNKPDAPKPPEPAVPPALPMTLMRFMRY